MNYGKLRSIGLLFLLICFLSSCHDSEKNSLVEAGKGRLVLSYIDIVVDVDTRSFSLPEISAEEMTIEIIDLYDQIVHSGNIHDFTNGIELFAATYTIKAYHGEKKAFNDQPYYEGTIDALIKEKESTFITLPVQLQSSIIKPDFSADLDNHFKSMQLNVIYDSTIHSLLKDEFVYVLPDSTYSMQLEGLNCLDATIIQTINNTFIPERAKIYNITCQLNLVLNLPEQIGGAWAKCLYVTPITSKDSNGIQVDIPNIEYQLISAADSDWTNALTASKDDNGNWVITGLTSETDYKVRAKIGDVISNEQTIKTEAAVQLPNPDMEEWVSTEFTNWNRWFPRLTKDEATIEGWCTLNSYTTHNENVRAYCSNSGTEPTSSSYTGNYAAEIKTIGWGDGTTAAGSASIIYNITPGQLFLGTINDYNNPDYYYTFNVRPHKISFYCKYEGKGTRMYHVSCKLYDADHNEIASVDYEEASVSDYSYRELILNYNKFTSTVEYMTLIFSSGDNSHGELDKGSISRSSRHTGNKLYIDKIELIYE